MFGVTGGQFQPQGHLQVVCNLLDHGMEPQQALDAARYHLEEDGSVSLEPPLSHLAGSFGRPDRIVEDPDGFGNGHLIVRAGDGCYRGGSEPRRDGLALGI